MKILHLLVQMIIKILKRTLMLLTGWPSVILMSLWFKSFCKGLWRFRHCLFARSCFQASHCFRLFDFWFYPLRFRFLNTGLLSAIFATLGNMSLCIDWSHLRDICKIVYRLLFLLEYHIHLFRRIQRIYCFKSAIDAYKINIFSTIIIKICCFIWKE